MPFRPHALLNNVEVRQLALLQPEELLDREGVMFSGSLRDKFAFDAVYVAVRNSRGSDKEVFRQLVITVRVRGRHDSLIYPEQMDALPTESRFHHLLEHQLRSTASRDGDGRARLAGKGCFEQRQNMPS